MKPEQIQDLPSEILQTKSTQYRIAIERLKILPNSFMTDEAPLAARVSHLSGKAFVERCTRLGLAHAKIVNHSIPQLEKNATLVESGLKQRLGEMDTLEQDIALIDGYLGVIKDGLAQNFGKPEMLTLSLEERRKLVEKLNSLRGIQAQKETKEVKEDEKQEIKEPEQKIEEEQAPKNYELKDSYIFPDGKVHTGWAARLANLYDQGVNKLSSREQIEILFGQYTPARMNQLHAYRGDLRRFGFVESSREVEQDSVPTIQLPLEIEEKEVPASEDEESKIEGTIEDHSKNPMVLSVTKSGQGEVWVLDLKDGPQSLQSVPAKTFLAILNQKRTKSEIAEYTGLPENSVKKAFQILRKLSGYDFNTEKTDKGISNYWIEELEEESESIKPEDIKDLTKHPYVTDINKNRIGPGDMWNFKVNDHTFSMSGVPAMALLSFLEGYKSYEEVAQETGSTAESIRKSLRGVFDGGLDTIFIREKLPRDGINPTKYRIILRPSKDPEYYQSKENGGSDASLAEMPTDVKEPQTPPHMRTFLGSAGLATIIPVEAAEVQEYQPTPEELRSEKQNKMLHTVVNGLLMRDELNFRLIHSAIETELEKEGRIVRDNSFRYRLFYIGSSEWVETINKTMKLIEEESSNELLKANWGDSDLRTYEEIQSLRAKYKQKYDNYHQYKQPEQRPVFETAFKNWIKNRIITAETEYLEGNSKNIGEDHKGKYFIVR